MNMDLSIKTRRPLVTASDQQIQNRYLFEKDKKFVTFHVATRNHNLFPVRYTCFFLFFWGIVVVLVNYPTSRSQSAVRTVFTIVTSSLTL